MGNLTLQDCYELSRRDGYFQKGNRKVPKWHLLLTQDTFQQTKDLSSRPASPAEDFELKIEECLAHTTVVLLALGV
jgi:hypothetical protein